jgi:hypothetical protein
MVCNIGGYVMVAPGVGMTRYLAIADASCIAKTIHKRERVGHGVARDLVGGLGDDCGNNRPGGAG